MCFIIDTLLLFLLLNIDTLNVCSKNISSSFTKPWLTTKCGPKYSRIEANVLYRISKCHFLKIPSGHSPDALQTKTNPGKHERVAALPMGKNATPTIR